MPILLRHSLPDSIVYRCTYHPTRRVAADANRIQAIVLHELLEGRMSRKTHSIAVGAFQHLPQCDKSTKRKAEGSANVFNDKIGWRSVPNSIRTVAHRHASPQYALQHSCAEAEELAHHHPATLECTVVAVSHCPEPFGAAGVRQA